MIETLKKLVSLLLLISVLSFTACRDENADEIENASGTNEESSGTTEESSADYCRIDGKDIYFISGEYFEALREPIVKLISNQEQWIDSGDFSIGYYHEIPDPTKPYIEHGEAFGLFDVTGDGMPELLLEPYGFTGTSGGRTWYIYDIYSGEKIGEIDGGYGDIWCCYYYRKDGGIYPVNRYKIRCGWGSLYISTSTIKYNEKYGMYLSAPCFAADQFVVTVKGELGVEDYTESRYYVFGERADMADYFYACGEFDMNCIRIPETELRVIDCYTVVSKDDDRFVRAEKIAEALLSSGQKFISPENISD